MSGDTESGLAICQLLKMFNKGQIDLATFKRLTANVAGNTANLPTLLSTVSGVCINFQQQLLVEFKTTEA